MATITHDLANILSTVRCHGDFYATGRSEIIMPTLDIDTVGRISLPLLAVQAEQLIKIAACSPFGRGLETLVDTDVRKTWQITPERVHMSGRNWPKTLDTLVTRAASGLGLAAPVAAELYKLLIYETGSFFVEHRDTEKSAGMFATLVLVLPSLCSGGELIVRHRGREVCLDLNCSDSAELAFAAFYADCVHEVRPVTSGYRLTLIYNLIRTDKGPVPTFADYEKNAAAVTDLLHRWVDNKSSPADATPEKLIYPLEHAYTLAELGFESLKNADAAAAAVLTAAASAADCDLHLALVSIDESGSAECCHFMPNRGDRRRYSDDESEEFEIGEIFERTLTVSDFRSVNGEPTPITALPFEEEQLCPPDVFEDAAPDEQYFHEATGNEGPSFERIYRRAALVLWPRVRRLVVLSKAGLAVTLPYLSALATRWAQSGDDKHVPLWCDAHALAGHMLRDWSVPGRYSSTDGTSSATNMLGSLVQLDDTAHIDAFLATVPAAGSYCITDNELLVRAAVMLSPSCAAERIWQIIVRNAYLMPGACADLLARLSADPGFVALSELLYPAAAVLVETLLEKRTAAAVPDPWQRRMPIDADALAGLLSFLGAISAASLAEQLVAGLLARPKSFEMNRLLIPAALKLTANVQTRHLASVRSLRAASMIYLRERIAEPLAPPADFARPSVIACHCNDCAELRRFLGDPVRREWVFKAVEERRHHVHASVKECRSDVDVTTSTRGRPYSLIATKNQASYDRRVVQRQSDLADFARLDGSSSG